MDDLMGEDWQKPGKPVSSTPTLPFTTAATSNANASSFGSAYSSMRTSPQPGYQSPANLSRPASTVNGGGAKQAGADSFSNLLSTSSKPKNSNGLSMQERQKQLMQEKLRQQQDQAKQWDMLGTGRSSPALQQTRPAQESESDILAAFHKDAPVDKACHFAPPPSSTPASRKQSPALPQQSRFQQPVPIASGAFDVNDDDDPFGLGSMPKQNLNGSRPPTTISHDNDDDILGDLGRPVSTAPPPKAPTPEPPAPRRTAAREPAARPSSQSTESDGAVAELVDMGFPADTARLALAETGGDVQSAVGWLLQQAHEKSKQEARKKPDSNDSRTASTNGSQRKPAGRDQSNVPSWMREEARSSSTNRASQNGSPAPGAERDAAQIAQEFGSKFLKSAGSFWKASQKQMAKTMADLQQSDSDSSQPKWMRDASSDASRSNSQRRAQQTDEASMLDAPRDRSTRAARPDSFPTHTELPARGRSPAEQAGLRPSRATPAQSDDRRPTSRLSRQDVEEQSTDAYISPARRKRPTAAAKVEEPVPDLFSPAPPSKPALNASVKTAKAAPPTPQASQSKAPARSIPPVSASALSTSASHRKAGTEHFKLGDYAAAHASYSAALTPLPPTHPIAIIVLSNHALTALKTGDAKAAVASADRALEIIGPGFGVNEQIDLGSDESPKEMKEFYGKALTRKAEALEHLEKYTEALTSWKLAIAASTGGTVALRGRDRCEKALAPKPKPKPNPKPTAPPSAPPANPTNPTNQPPTAASARLAASAAAATDLEAQRFALTDTVSARLAAWRTNKQSNLRALLQSLDSILWPGSGWSKPGMSELLTPQGVKRKYMLAVAKVHPDKISNSTSGAGGGVGVEERMVAEGVFATLCEAWDAFREGEGKGM